MASKVAAIHQWHVPHSIKVVRIFLGLAGFYQRFIRSYVTIVALMVKTTTIEPFVWTPQA